MHELQACSTQWSQILFKNAFVFLLKVSKSPKQIVKFSFEPKNERKYFCISALASKIENKKNKGTLYHSLEDFLFDLFLEARAEILEKISLMLEDLKTPKEHFEINCPLQSASLIRP